MARMIVFAADAAAAVVVGCKSLPNEPLGMAAGLVHDGDIVAVDSIPGIPTADS